MLSSRGMFVVTKSCALARKSLCALVSRARLARVGVLRSCRHMLDKVSTRNLAMLLIAGLGCALFIWPGQWRYSTVDRAPMRTHRITGRSELFFSGEWVTLDGQRK